MPKVCWNLAVFLNCSKIGSALQTPFGLNFLLEKKKFLPFGRKSPGYSSSAAQWRYYSKALQLGRAQSSLFPHYHANGMAHSYSKVGDKALTFVAENYCVLLGL